ncbi:putative receptor-like protein kinase At3g47110 [Phoenix dactylifera]|uniref:Receptor kinase-like protein Xa21 n=1 Tax=Phoenix dactylifera TaxID=42345 RepID=A0A8B7C4U6_PHODC|nr:putative receptor-like protein kinase At3g47110 [Phoenix dactylifera]
MDVSLGLSVSTLALVLLMRPPFPSIFVESSSLSNITDQEALLSFKTLITSDPSDVLSSWNDSTTVCQWSRVLCNNKRRVSTLDLKGLGLSGSISPHIGNLSALQFLYLQDNHFTGDLPDQLGNLARLQILNASSNLIGGAIPPNISKCSNLNTLDLALNTIYGKIPTDLGLLSELRVLKLGQNLLTGNIPPSIGNLSSLTTLNLGTNNLSGPIPSDLGRLQNLQELQISVNKLTGTVPPVLYNISSLETFAFASNELHGEFPSDLGFRLPKLLVFHFCFNKFTGQYPPSLHNITKIQSIRMSHNFLVGSVPPGLGTLHDLIMYNIGFNFFVSSGSSGLDLITSLTNSSKLAYLAIDENHLEGVIPDSVGNLSTSLSKLYMGGNRIYGSIPASIGKLTKLTLLNMSHNLISGEIPAEIGRLKELRILGLAGNKLLGEIPAAFGNLSMLIHLELYGNELEGTIPATFSEFQKLLSLDLSTNRLNGSIPREPFTLTSLNSLMNLSNNFLTGPLPDDIGGLENLIALDLSNNLLSGKISDSIGNCRSMEVLSMSDNSFTGLIPNTIGNLKGLQSLDLSSNKLSGSIPESMGKLRSLQFLNLSLNNLEGEIPNEGIFLNLSAVHLEGNPKLCMSSLCPHSSSRNISKALLVILVASAAFVLFLLVVLYWVFFIRKKQIDAKVTTADSIKAQHRVVSYEELHRATENFDPRYLIGTGSFGSVYKGVLRDGMTAAIKVLNLATSGAWKSFVAECEALRNARHRNLVKLVTLCSSLDFGNNDFLALVYEFMGNGSLEDWIRGRRRHEGGGGLSVIERLTVAIDVASAMDYLHNDCEAQVVHCDLKPSNVLLDEEMTAKVGDFGLAKLLLDKPEGQDSTTSTNRLRGSIGYIPPEYGFGGKPSTKGDVYSFGVLLLELLTAKSPTDEGFEGGLNLEKWVRAAFPSHTMEVTDANLIVNVIGYEGRQISPEKQAECLVSMVGVGLSCAIESAEARITIRDAFHQLKGIKKTLLKPHAATRA